MVGNRKSGTGKQITINSLPVEITVAISGKITSRAYELMAITLWDKSHYTAKLLYNGSWYFYDGMKNGLVAQNREVLPDDYTPTYSLYVRKDGQKTQILRDLTNKCSTPIAIEDDNADDDRIFKAAEILSNLHNANTVSQERGHEDSMCHIDDLEQQSCDLPSVSSVQENTSADGEEDHTESSLKAYYENGRVSKISNDTFLVCW